MKKFTADFETTTDPNDCRVWAYSLCEIGNIDNFIYGNNIEDFINFCANKYENYQLWFHNLKFDGEYIFNYLLNNGFEFVKDKKLRRDKTFTCLISDMGQFYSIEIYFHVTKKHTNKVTIFDSMKVLNFSVDKIAEDFKLPIRKLNLDYDEKREIGHILTQHEIDYIRNDVEIMARALQFMFDENLLKMTIGSDALTNYKKMNKNFNKYFPVLDFVIDNYQYNPAIYNKKLYCNEDILLAVPVHFPVNKQLKDYQLSYDDILSKGNHFQNHSSIPLHFFSELPFIMLTHGNDTRIRGDHLCQKAGFRPKIILEFNQQTTAYMAASTQLGATFISDMLVSQLPSFDNLVYYKLDGEAAKREVYFYYKSHRYQTRAMEEFLAMGSRYVTPMMEMQAHDSLRGMFGCSGDIGNVPPCAVTVGPRDLAAARERIDVESLPAEVSAETGLAWPYLPPESRFHDALVPRHLLCLCGCCFRRRIPGGCRLAAGET